MAAVGAVNIKFGAVTTDFVAAMKGAAGSVQSAVNEMNADLTSFYKRQDRQQAAFTKGFARLGDDFKSVGRNLTIGLTAPLVALTGVLFKSYAEIDSNIRGFKALSGSAEQAANSFKTYLAVAKLPGLGLQEAQEAGLRMEALGFSTQKAKNYLVQFGNAVALGGGGRTQFDQILVQLTQMSSKSKVLAEDLKPIVSASPVVAKALREMFGSVDSEQISKQLQASGKTASDFLDMLVTKLGTLQRVEGGPRNALENLSDATKIAGYNFIAAADQAFDLTGGLTRLGDTLTSTAEGFADLSPETQKAILGVTGFAAAIGPASLAIGSFVQLLPLLRSGFAALTGPIAAAAAAATALTVLSTSIYDYGKSIDDTIDKNALLSGVQKDVTEGIKGEVDRLRELDQIAFNELNNKKARIDALNEIRSIAPQYLGNLDLEAFKTGKATQAIEKYIKILALKTEYQKIDQRINDAYSGYNELDKKKTDSFGGFGDYIGAFVLGFPTEGSLSEQVDKKRLERKKAQLIQFNNTINDLTDQQIKIKQKLEALGENADPLKSGATGPGAGGVNAAGAALDAKRNQLKKIGDEIGDLLANKLKVPAERFAEYRKLQKELRDIDSALSSPKKQRPEKSYFEKELLDVERKILEFRNKYPGIEIPLFLRYRQAEVQQILGRGKTPDILAKQAQEIALKGNDFKISAPADLTAKLQPAIDNLKAFNEQLMSVYGELQRSIQTASIDTAATFADGLGQVIGGVISGQKNVLKSLLKLGFDMLASYLAQVARAHIVAGTALALLGITNPILAAAGKKQLVAGIGLQVASGVVRGISNAIPFANGGIVSGPTYAMVGEYAGARNNPEVIAPLNKLRDYMGEGGSRDVRVYGEFELRNDRLVAAVRKGNRMETEYR
ncbi:hypothetical protein GCM10027299_21580 [Larkinella ripae]